MPDGESRPFDAVCSQHKMHPEKCWKQHVVHPTTRAKTREEELAFIANAHIEKQRENERKASEQTASPQEARTGSETGTQGVSQDSKGQT